jgi:hypothetical protein
MTAPFTAAGQDFEIDAALVAPQLGLSVEQFWQELRRGIVYGAVERGIDEDAGRVRLTFRYRARSWSVTLDEAQAASSPNTRAAVPPNKAALSSAE